MTFCLWLPDVTICAAVHLRGPGPSPPLRIWLSNTKLFLRHVRTSLWCFLCVALSVKRSSCPAASGPVWLPLCRSLAFALSSRLQRRGGLRVHGEALQLQDGGVLGIKGRLPAQDDDSVRAVHPGAAEQHRLWVKKGGGAREIWIFNEEQSQISIFA